MFAAGIDGGGTSTRLELRSLGNDVLERRTFGAFNANSVGEAGFRQRLREVFGCCEMHACAALCIGAAGLSNPLVGRILEEELKNAGFSGRLKLVGDQEIALRGAMDGPGIVLIAGTGSIAFGKNEAGETARCGGYGHRIDDEGSGYALGRDALSAVVRAHDGRGPKTILCERVFQALQIGGIPQLVAFTYGKDTDKGKIAALSQTVIACAREEDGEALAILEKGAGELAVLVSAVQKKLGLQGCTIALLGGLLSEPNPYRAMVQQRLGALGVPVTAVHDALWGAAQMAVELLPGTK